MSKSDPFYVGYLPIPRGLKHFVIVVSTISILALLTAATVIAVVQRDPGDAVWDLDGSTQIEGTLSLHPHPTLHPHDPALPPLLIVSEGKIGADDVVAHVDGKSVQLTGYLLRRGKLSMLELIDPTAKPSARAAHPIVATIEPTARTFTGEIIDPKCFTGAMKPGEGKPHKACAILCLRGGIPPVFRTTSGDCYLLVDQDGNALRDESLESVLPFVADSVELTGTLARVGGLTHLRLSSNSIRRQ